MGRNKGKQSGTFSSKSQYALHRHTLYVDHASEANRYRSSSSSSRHSAIVNSPSSSSSSSQGSHRGFVGYRNDDCAGYWHADGTAYGGRDKWSTLFPSTNSQTNRSTAAAAAAEQRLHHPHHDDTVSLSNGRIHSSRRRSGTATTGLLSRRLRSVLEERRAEDRLYEREHRLRLQRSRLFQNMETKNAGGTKETMDQHDDEEERHEPGWLLSHHCYHETGQPPPPGEGSNAIVIEQRNAAIAAAVLPSLQLLAAQTLGPVLPLFCRTACGAELVGKSLKSVSAEILSELFIALAKNINDAALDWPSYRIVTNNGVVRSIMYSGVATGIVLRGGGGGGDASYCFHSEIGTETRRAGDVNILDDDDYDDDDDDEGKWFNDDGLLSLCPRILPANCYAPDNDEDELSCDGAEADNQSSSWENWEVQNFDMGLNSRMLGCFHLKRLELIDVPLLQDMSTTSPSSSSSLSYSGGITIRALCALLRSCSGITHLSLSGCFANLEDATMSAIENLSVFLGGNLSVSSLSYCIDLLGKRHDITDLGKNILPHLDFLCTFEEITDERDSIPPINSILPDLEVLDVSHCGWVSPEMIIRLLLNGWKRCLASISDGAKNQRGCEEAIENDGRNLAKVYPTLRHVNIRGCSRLQSGNTSQLQWMDEWRQHGLFDGIDISTQRQLRI